jgi:hypothetical protein
MVVARFSIAVFLLACFSLAFSQFSTSQQTIRWRSLASGTNANIARSSILIAGDLGVLENIWRNSCQSQNPLPKVDFSQDRVVFYFAGTRNTGGYSVSIRNVLKELGTSATLYVNEIIPGKGEISTQALTSPWVAIICDRSYLDFSVKVNQVQNTPLPFGTIQTSPYSLTTILWTPCWVGWGPVYDRPTCYDFDNYQDVARWELGNSVSFGQTISRTDFTQRRFVLVNGGSDFSGYATEIQSVSQEQNTTWVRIRRGNRVARSDAGYLSGFYVDRKVRNFQIEMAYTGSEVMVSQGAVSPFPRSGSFVCRSLSEFSSLAGFQVAADAPDLRGMNFTTHNLGVIAFPPMMAGAQRVNEMVVRGGLARVSMAINRNATIPLTQAGPYFLVRLPKSVSKIELLQN